MYRKLLLSAIATQLLFWPTRLNAGGPPWLCVPIGGVTPDNAAACTDLIEAKLAKKLWPQTERFGGVAIHHGSDQQYLTFYMKEDVQLGEIEAALKGSDYSIPRDRLRLFGHVVLEIDARKSPSKELAAALKSLEQVAIAEWEDGNGFLRVTVEMPYPVADGRPTQDTSRWTRFARFDYTSAESSKSATPVAPSALPSYNAFRDVLAKHHATLKDIRWSTAYACRALGCVSVTKADGAIATASKPPRAD
jgi:hypothetical protein